MPWLPRASPSPTINSIRGAHARNKQVQTLFIEIHAIHSGRSFRVFFPSTNFQLPTKVIFIKMQQQQIYWVRERDFILFSSPSHRCYFAIKLFVARGCLYLCLVYIATRHSWRFHISGDENEANITFPNDSVFSHNLQWIDLLEEQKIKLKWKRKFWK